MKITISLRKGGAFLLEYSQCDILLFLYMTVILTHNPVPYLKFILWIACIAHTLYQWVKVGINQIAFKNVKTVLLWYGVFFVWVYLSKYWAYVQRPDSDIVSSMVRIFPICICIANRITTRTRLNTYIDIFIVSTTYFAIIYLATSPLSTWGTIDMGGITGQWRNFSGHLCGCAAIMSWIVYQLSKRKKYIFCTVICALCVVLTGSRAALLGLGFMFSVNMMFQKDLVRRSKNLLLLLVLLIVAIYVLFTNDYLYEIYGSRLVAVFSDSVKDGSRDDRVMYQELGIAMFLQKPLLGWGMDNFAYYLHYIGGYSQEVYSHCNYVEILSCYGIIGFVIYYVKYIQSLVIVYRHRYLDVLMKMFLVVLLRFVVFEYATITFSVYSYVYLLTIVFSGINLLCSDTLLKECE